MSVAAPLPVVKWFSVSDRNRAALRLHSRHYTFSGIADPRFVKAGWSRLDTITKKNRLVVLERLP